MIFAFGNVLLAFNMSISASVAGIVVLLLRRIKSCRGVWYIYYGNSFYQNVDSGGIRSKYSLMTLISKFTTKSVVLYDGTLDFSFTNYIMAADNYFPVTYKEDMLENLFSIASVVWIIVAVALSLIFAILYVLAKSELKDASLYGIILCFRQITSPAAYGVSVLRLLFPKVMSYEIYIILWP